MSRKLIGVAALTIALVVGLSSAAFAFFTASATAIQLATSATLGAPGTVTAGATGATGLSVTVTAGSSTPAPTGYVVYPHGSTSSPACTISSASGNCTVGGLPAGTTTSYDVYSTLGNWISSSSGPISGTTTPAKPTGVSIAGTGVVGASNKSATEVDVTLPATSKISDTVHVTITDGTTTITVPVKAGTNGAGTLTFTGIDLSALLDGPLMISAWSTNAGGPSVILTTSAVKDTSGPTPTITTPATGAYVATTTPTVSGTAGTQAADSSHSADGATVTVKIYAGATATGTPVQTLTGTVSGGTWSVTPTTLTGNAQYTAQVTQSDGAGNSGTGATTFVIDTHAPAVTLTAPVSGSTTTTLTPTFSGTAGSQTADSTHSADGSTVTVKIYAGTTAAGTPVQTITTAVGAGGAWSVPASSALSAGQQYTAIASQSDGGGSNGASSAVTFTAGPLGPVALKFVNLFGLWPLAINGYVELVDVNGDPVANALSGTIVVTVVDSSGDHDVVHIHSGDAVSVDQFSEFLPLFGWIYASATYDGQTIHT
ncbi:MAG TPA: hypothetical protein VHV76_12230 [Mycobacteriales bacterium]|nr:hypothetical protein [Mycobacteriales bacterium]